MLLLVADTSGKQGSVALVRSGDARAGEDAKPYEVEVFEEIPLAGGAFSAQLVPQIAALLSKHAFSKTDIDAFIVVSGPGSFTGLRVGLAAVKALAEVLNKPIVAVSLLEVVAQAAGVEGKVVAVLDAGRNEIYVGEYEVARKSARCVSEHLLPISEFARGVRQAVVVTPDVQLAELLRSAGLRITLVERPHAAAIARAGWEKLLAGEIVAPEQLDANYIRRSDAEIFARPAPGS